MDSREPAGWEGEKGKSAEPLLPGAAGGWGRGEYLRDCLRQGRCPAAGALSAYSGTMSSKGTCVAVGRGVSLPTFCFRQPCGRRGAGPAGRTKQVWRTLL